MATLKGDFTSTNEEISQVKEIFLCNAVKSSLWRRGRVFARPHLHDEKVLLIFITVKSQKMTPTASSSSVFTQVCSLANIPHFIQKAEACCIRSLIFFYRHTGGRKN